MEKEELEALVAKALEEHPEVFPGNRQIISLLKKYGRGVSEHTLFSQVDLPALQLIWIRSCSERVFFENIKAIGNLDKKCQEAYKERFNEIVRTIIKKNPDIFPSGHGIADLLNKQYRVKLDKSTIAKKIDIPSLQLEWMLSATERAFLKNFTTPTFSNIGEKGREAAAERFRKIVEAKLKDSPEIFPSANGISRRFVNGETKVYHPTISRKIDLVPLQINWINSSADKIFLDTLSGQVFNRLDKRCNDQAKERLFKIAKIELEKYPEIFPGGSNIAGLIEKAHGTKLDPTTVWRNLDLPKLQINWIKTCHEKAFFEKLSKKILASVDKSCRSAVDERMHSILLSNIKDLSNVPISPVTLNVYLKKFPDLAFILVATHEHRHTIDQRIVLDMHVWRETRSEHLHKLIGARLDQLWGFRELFALMKDGRCLDADVISMFHESLPERIGNYISESTVTHSFVDNLRAGAFKAGKGKDVLLLSFMHWLADKQSAEIMLRLNQSVGTDNAIYMTSPNGLEYAEDLIASMNTFGFVPEKVGSLYLIPPSESEEDEQRKLLTKGKVLQFRKIQDVEKAPEELQLFSREKKKKGGARIEPKADIISYDEKTLKNSLPLITMKDVGVIFTEEIPEVKKVEVEGEHAILTLKGGVVLGFNVEPEHPYSIEVEGRKLPKGIDNAVLDLTNGKEGFEVGKGLKKKYKEFMKLVKGKREQMGPVKKKVLKKQG